MFPEFKSFKNASFWLSKKSASLLDVGIAPSMASGCCISVTGMVEYLQDSFSCALTDIRCKENGTHNRIDDKA
jgi:hypothetical protein